MSEGFVSVIRRHAAERGDALAYRFLHKEVEVERLTFAALDSAARRIAAALAPYAGKPVMLIFPPGLDFVKAFIDCWYAKVVPVPWAPPLRPQDVTRALGIAKHAGIAAVLTVEAIQAPIAAALEGLEAVSCLALEPMLAAPEAPFVDPGSQADAIALLQYTSGSTSESKGVVVTHANLVANQRMIEALFGHDQETRVVGWLPLYHDMGLIGNVLQPLWLGRDVTLMSPIDFIQKPLSWLRAISNVRATTSGGPNFAYELCAAAAEEHADELAEVDLSSWTLAYNGAEPIRANTLERFADAFAPYGFRRTALYPCYGLAEATLIVTGARKGERFVTRHVDREALARNEVVTCNATAASVPLVGCGRATAETAIRIVDPESLAPAPPRTVGEIWIASPSVARGYWRHEGNDSFGATLEGEARWLRTGDLGFLEGDELFVAGRLKDLLIVRGRNHHPQDIEQTSWESHEALRPGRGAAFSIEVEGEERVVVVQETVRDANKNGPLDEGEIAARVRANVARAHGLTLFRFVMVPPGKVPRTSSGKIRRRECRRLFLENAF